MSIERIRIQNARGGAYCDHCANGGLAVVSRRPAHNRPDAPLVDEYGPCPWCERGYALEFPEHGRGAWGHDGYWQGRRPDADLWPTEGRLLPVAENNLRVELLMRRNAGQDVDPCVGLDMPDDAARMRLVQAAVRKSTAA